MQDSNTTRIKKITRKPNSTITQQLRHSYQADNKQPQNKLQLHNHIFSISIKEEHQQTENPLLSSFLFSLDSTPIRPELNCQVSKVSLQSQLKLQYSPDTIISTNHYQSILEDSDLLIDSQPLEKEAGKYEASTAAANKISQEHYPATLQCSAFSLTDFRDEREKFCLQIHLLSINSYVFKLEYYPLPLQQADSIKGDKLIARTKKYFKNNISSLFQFYQTVLLNYTQQTLKLFFISQAIKFSSREIENTERNITHLLAAKTPGEVLQILFLNKKEEDSFIVNLQHEHFCDQLDLTSHSFWTAFLPFAKAQNFFTGKTSPEIKQLCTFVSCLL